MDLPEEVRLRVARARRAVAFTGAGISKESGLDTFRDLDGVWQKVRPEDMATLDAFRRRPAVVWRWYAERFTRADGVAPNPAHLALARLEEEFPYFTLVTQNVDGLHQRAGSRNLIELHGTLAFAKCDYCGRRLPMGEAVASSPERPPACDCGGLLRPAVVWFGETLPPGAMERAAEEASLSEIFLSIGTSGSVYPAAGLIEVAYENGACLIEINPEPTPFSRFAHLTLRAPAGEALPALTEAILACRHPRR
ncbi:MAG: NAD-dependent deacetylase [Acidobacteriota bacterium]|jgi:NAD-dependent deacetylase|nr:NAD-dependent deacetylase [Acidobacteriota bacterium]